MEPLTEALKEMNNLHTLDLSHNEIGDDGIRLLAELFDQYLCNLQVLILNYNKFSKVGIEILTEKLEKLSQLHILDYSYLEDYHSEVLSPMTEIKKNSYNLV